MKLLKTYFLNNKWLWLILALAAFVRFYNFPNRVTFWSEQARSLIVSSEYLKKPSLLGQEYFRTDSNGHILFSGAVFNYSLVPLILVTKGDPLLITAFFALLNLFAGIVIYLVVKKIFNIKLALFSTILFLFNNFMIYHSLFIWNYNYLPLVGILIVYSYYRRKVFWSGVLSGIGIGLQFLFTPIALLILIASLIKSKKKIFDFFKFVSGIILGNLPLILFDLRHQFYQSKTLFRYFLDTLRGQSDATLNYYYLLPFWPILAVLGGFILFWIWRKSRVLAAAILTLYIFLNLSSKMVNWENPTGMPEGIKLADIDRASFQIAKDAGGQFNVAEVLDFDKRAYVLRYFVQYKYRKTPERVEDYPNSKLVYVLAPHGFDFGNSGIWEIKSGGPYTGTLLTEVGQGYQISKLQYCQMCK